MIDPDYYLNWRYQRQWEEEYAAYDDRILKGAQRLHYQKEVYDWARDLIAKNGWEEFPFLDYGCGTAAKTKALVEQLGRRGGAVGYEPQQEMSDWLTDEYLSDSLLHFTSGDPHELADEFSMVICADVIEHVKRPDVLLDALRNLNTKSYVISTPARRSSDNGPPKNKGHWQEWNVTEFEDFLEAMGFSIQDTRLTESNTQIHFCL